LDNPNSTRNKFSALSDVRLTAADKLKIKTNLLQVMQGQRQTKLRAWRRRPIFLGTAISICLALVVSVTLLRHGMSFGPARTEMNMHLSSLASSQASSSTSATGDTANTQSSQKLVAGTVKTAPAKEPSTTKGSQKTSVSAVNQNFLGFGLAVDGPLPLLKLPVGSSHVALVSVVKVATTYATGQQSGGTVANGPATPVFMSVELPNGVSPSLVSVYSMILPNHHSYALVGPKGMAGQLVGGADQSWRITLQKGSFKLQVMAAGSNAIEAVKMNRSFFGAVRQAAKYDGLPVQAQPALATRELDSSHALFEFHTTNGNDVIGIARYVSNSKQAGYLGSGAVEVFTYPPQEAKLAEAVTLSALSFLK